MQLFVSILVLSIFMLVKAVCNYFLGRKTETNHSMFWVFLLEESYRELDAFVKSILTEIIHAQGKKK